MNQFKKTLCLDFDGVIHSYKSGWKGADVIPDEPVPGTKEAIDELRKEWKVVVYSSRSGQPGGKDAMAKWFLEHGIEVDELADHKPPAMMYIDDRGITFNGDWRECILSIHKFKHWMKANV